MLSRQHIIGLYQAVQSVRLRYGLRGIQPIRFEIRFERKKNNSQVPSFGSQIYNIQNSFSIWNQPREPTTLTRIVYLVYLLG